MRYDLPQEPDTIIPLLDSIQRIADQAESLLASATTSSGSSTTRLEQLSDLARLIEQNHSHLVSLGVSHPALETVRNKTRDQPWGLATKLTGAGGGGCAVTVVPDGEWSCIVHHGDFFFFCFWLETDPVAHSTPNRLLERLAPVAPVRIGRHRF